METNQVDDEKVSAQYAEEYLFSETHRWANNYAEKVKKKVENNEMKEDVAHRMLNAIGKTAQEADYSQMQYIKWLKAEHQIFQRKKEATKDLEQRKAEILSKYKGDPEQTGDLIDKVNEYEEEKELSSIREALLNKFNKNKR